MGRIRRVRSGHHGHAFAFVFAVAAAAAAGCSGGGGGSTPGTGATATPTASASGSSPTPVASSTASAGVTAAPFVSPTPIPTALASAQAVTTRPLANGDAFTYAGSIVTTLSYNGTSPAPQTTSVATVSQSVTLKEPASAFGVADQTDVHVVETDTTPLQTSTATTDEYESLSNGTLVASGTVVTTSSGYASTTTYATPYQLDVLPESSGSSFTNSPAATIAETEPGGYSSSRTYASDGSYTDKEVYPATAGSGSATPNASVVEYHDGHGTYSLPLQGYATNSTISVASPAPSNTISLTLAVPDPTVSPMTVGVPVWFSQPLALYRESNLQTGTKTVPSDCGVPSAIAVTANALVAQIERVDTVLGTDETTNSVSYVAPTYGLVCLQMNDVTKSYYDYAGESLNGVAIAGAATPLEIDEVQASFGMTVATKADAAGRRDAGAAIAVRTAALRGGFDRVVARVAAARLRRALGGSVR